MIKRVLRRLLNLGLIVNYNKDSDQAKEIRPMTKHLIYNLNMLREVFDKASDVIVRDFTINFKSPVKASILFIEGLCDQNVISDHLIKTLLTDGTSTNNALPGKGNSLDLILNRLTGLTNVKTTSDLIELTGYVLEGNTALLIDGSSTVLIVGTQGWDKRVVDEPAAEQTVRGPKDGFIEDLRTNTAMIRRRIKSPNLKIDAVTVGYNTKTRIEILYLKGTASDKVVEEVKQRLNRITIDGILESGYIEELISDEAFNLFPLIQNTERADKVAAAILEGRVAIIVDTTPIALIVPITFVSLLQSSEDYYQISLFSTAVRLVRLIALHVTLLLPAFYIAIISFHQEFLPPGLMKKIISGRVGVPFPTFIEALNMEIAFEILREAGLRLPRNVGQAVSTVGGLIIGQAAVAAGIISPIMVVVVSLTAVASFAIPNYSAGFSLRILRFGLMLLATLFGIPGIMMGLMVILFHLAGLRSFGVPYLSPVAPLSLRDLKDTFIRVPHWALSTRPRSAGSQKPMKQSPNSGPEKP